jgi:hypothetical protein
MDAVGDLRLNPPLTGAIFHLLKVRKTSPPGSIFAAYADEEKNFRLMRAHSRLAGRSLSIGADQRNFNAKSKWSK